jgi:hypothetical protein
MDHGSSNPATTTPHRRPRHGPRPGRLRLALGSCLAMALVATACSDGGGNNSASGSGSGGDTTTTEAAGSGAEQPQPTAPEDQRVDLEEPTFSNPTEIHNPLFPISDLHATILLGNDEGHPLKIETTLLPDHKVITLENGDEVETLVYQFVAYLDGQIHEVALDWYAQADDGALWYFGEDVYNYEDGVVADTEGTWVAGEDGPPGMIMPANPQVGDAFRPENIPDFVFEEVVVSQTGRTVDGPRGPVDGAIVGTENHLMEGHFEDKWFAPGYGEFRSGVGGNLEAMALAVPTDALDAPMPAELEALSTGATDIFDAAANDDWDTATSSLAAMQSAWSTLSATGVPPLLAEEMTKALEALVGDLMAPAVEAHNAEGSRSAAIDVAQAALDLQLQYRPVTDVDRGRFALWAQQLVVDSQSDEPDPGQSAGDVASLEWIWDRIQHTVDADAANDIQAQLDDLRTAADDEDLATVQDAAPQLVDTVASLSPSSSG